MTIYITCRACIGITAYGETGYGHQMKDQQTAIIIAKIYNYQYVNTFHKPATTTMGLHNNCASVNELRDDIHKEYIEKVGIQNGMSFPTIRRIQCPFSGNIKRQRYTRYSKNTISSVNTPIIRVVCIE